MTDRMDSALDKLEQINKKAETGMVSPEEDRLAQTELALAVEETIKENLLAARQCDRSVRAMVVLFGQSGSVKS